MAICNTHPLLEILSQLGVEGNALSWIKNICEEPTTSEIQENFLIK